MMTSQRARKSLQKAQSDGKKQRIEKSNDKVQSYTKTLRYLGKYVHIEEKNRL